MYFIYYGLFLGIGFVETLVNSFHLLVLATKMQLVSANTKNCESVFMLFYIFTENAMITCKHKDINIMKMKYISKPSRIQTL